MAQPTMAVRIAANLSELKKNLAEGKDQIEAVRAGFTKLATSFQGDKIIQAAHNAAAAVESIGGASKLTDAEQARVNATVQRALDKYAALGREAPQALRELAAQTRKVDENTGFLNTTIGKMAAGFTVANLVDKAAGSVANFARESFQSAGVILDLSSKTGLSTKSIQEMELAATLTGTSLEAFTNAAFKLGINIAGGSNSVKASVEKLGLSYADLKAQSPDEQFNTIATKLGDVQSAQERNKLAVELFGKAAKDILPSIAQGYRDIADSAIIAGDNQLQAVDAASDALDALYVSAKSFTTEVLGRLVIGVQNWLAFWGDATGAVLTPFTAAWDKATLAMEAWGLKAQELPTVSGPANASLGHGAEAAKALTMSFDDINRVSDELTAKLKEQTTAVDAGTEGHGRHAPAVRASAAAHSDLSAAVAKGTFDLNAMAGWEEKATAETARLAAAQRKAAADGLAMFLSLSKITTELQHQTPLLSTSTNAWVGFAGTVQQQSASAATSTGGFMDKLKGLFGGGGSGEGGGGGSKMSQILGQIGPQFAAAFSGPGSAGDKMKAFATQAAGTLMGMIPGVGPWLQAFSGPIVEGLTKLASKAKDILSGIFGGPSGTEKEQRSLVDEFEKDLANGLTATQKLEAGGEAWKQTVIAVRDAYMAQGRTAAEAEADVKMLWESSKKGAGATAAALAEIKRKMAEAAIAGKDMADTVTEALNDIPRDIDININGKYNQDGEPPGFATGSNGIKDFGRGTMAILHGKERVQTEAQMNAEKNSGGGDMGEQLSRVMDFLEYKLPLAMRDAMAGA